MHSADLPAAKRMASDLTSIKDRLGRLGLFKTMHAMDAPLHALGFEIEEHLMHHAEVARKQQDAEKEWW